MSKKKIKNIMAGTAVVLALSSPIVVGSYTAVKVGFNTPLDYERTAKVEYNGENYYLFQLYKFISPDGEEHFCSLESSSSHLEFGARLKSDGLGFGLNVASNPKVYVDIDTGEEIAVEGYESIGGYKIEKVADLFPFEEYGSREIVVIPQDQFASVVGINQSMHR